MAKDLPTDNSRLGTTEGLTRWLAGLRQYTNINYTPGEHNLSLSITITE